MSISKAVKYLFFGYMLVNGLRKGFKIATKKA